jgi:molybdopterin-guanine dinucleotide biosynthesis protein A
VAKCCTAALDKRAASWQKQASLTPPRIAMSLRFSDVTGLILAGGLGRRMGGVDKGLALLDGRPLAAHVIERLAPQVGTVLINANRNPEAYGTYGYPVLADRIDGFVGPLAGLHAGLAACTTPLLVSAPCDSPFLPLDLVARLHEALHHANSQLAAPRTGDGLQPAFALMRREVLADLAAYLDAGGRRMQAWFGQLRLATVDFPDGAAFGNINTAEELAAITRPALSRP